MMLPFEARRGRKSAHGGAAPAFPAQQLFILGMKFPMLWLLLLPLPLEDPESRSSKFY